MRRVGRGESPAWSPDGRQLAFVAAVRPGTVNVFVADADGKRTRRLTHARSVDAFPTFSPRGDRLAFLSARPGFRHEQVYVLDVTSGRVRRLTSQREYPGVEHTPPQWSGDGRTVFYLDRRPPP